MEPLRITRMERTYSVSNQLPQFIGDTGKAMAGIKRLGRFAAKLEKDDARIKDAKGKLMGEVAAFKYFKEHLKEFRL
jgi:hypothetical protein